MEPVPVAASYAESRSDFVRRAEAAGASLGHHIHPAVGRDGEQLAIDVARLGAPDTRAALVVVSGTHGVEGFAGSALQRSWLRDRVAGLPDGVAVVLVHALNPYGFSWIRRGTEGNVDLNRNFVDFSRCPRNDRYGEVAELLVPERWDPESCAEGLAALAERAAHWGGRAMQEVVTGGQWEDPTGLYFGGFAPTWSHRRLDALCASVLAPFAAVAIVDLHTGLGAPGAAELISSAGVGDPPYERARSWYGAVTSHVEGDSSATRLRGSWQPWIVRRLTPAAVTPVTLEYGTVDGLQTFEALRGDAWRARHPDADPSVVAGIEERMRAAYAPADDQWMRAAYARFLDVVAAALAGLAAADGATGDASPSPA